jgi:hypothetical protein
MPKEEYLGDGLYASFDGFQFCLRAPDTMDGDRVVYLEHDVVVAFERYVKKTYAQALANNETQAGV